MHMFKVISFSSSLAMSSSNFEEDVVVLCVYQWSVILHFSVACFSSYPPRVRSFSFIPASTSIAILFLFLRFLFLGLCPPSLRSVLLCMLLIFLLLLLFLPSSPFQSGFPLLPFAFLFIPSSSVPSFKHVFPFSLLVFLLALPLLSFQYVASVLITRPSTYSTFFLLACISCHITCFPPYSLLSFFLPVCTSIPITCPAYSFASFQSKVQKMRDRFPVIGL